MRRWIIGYGLLLSLATSTFVKAAEYWVAPDGDDSANGKSRQSAWASPSRGQPTRLREGHVAGDKMLSVLSTEGFLPSGRVIVGGHTRNYTAKSDQGFELSEPIDEALPAYAFVYDADILGGDSFDPGDIIQLAGGEYINRPLNFCKSGSEGQPITYCSAPGERAVLISKHFNLAPIKRLGSWRKDKTEHVILKDISVRNQSNGNHGAGGIELYGVAHLRVEGCNIDISGRDINGDCDGIKLFGANDVTVTDCRIRSRMANGVMVWQSNDVHVMNSIVYESFNGIHAAGGRFPAQVTVSHCTIYAINQHGGISAEPTGSVTVTNSIIAQTPSIDSPALRGPCRGDYNCLWHNAANYGKGWNGVDTGTAGEHDIYADPQFISLNPRSPDFLKIAADSPAATAGDGGGYVGAFAPMVRSDLPKGRIYNVRKFGAIADGKDDDLGAIQAAIAKAASHGGGTIMFPPSSKPYLVSDTIQINADRIRLTGKGATIKLKAGAGRMDLIQVGSRQAGRASIPVSPVVENVTVENLTLDGSYRSQLQKRIGNNPRGVWVGHANHVVLRDLIIRDTFCGVTFGPGSRNSEAIDVTVTDWDHDAFGASGRGINGSCTDIRFVRCKAVDTPRCVKAWEIEEGSQRVTLEDCHIENIGGTGTGYYVRHHEYNWPLLVDDVTFVRCSVRNIAGAGFLISTVPGSGPRSIRPFIRTRNVRLIDCTSEAPVTIVSGVEQVQISGGQFSNMGVGFDAVKVDREYDVKWPVRSVHLQNASIDRIKINAQTGNPNGKLGDRYWPDYEPRIQLTNVQLSQPAEIIGNEANVIIDGSKDENAVLPELRKGEPLVLVKGGTALSTIVVADDADWWQRMAAGWLQDYVERATGAKLAMVRESEAPRGTLISVGHTRMAATAGITTEDLKWDGCKIVVKGDVLYLIGRDATGVGRSDPSPEKMKDFLEGDPWRYDRIAGPKGSDLAGANGTCKAVVTFLEDICGVRWFMPTEQGIRIPKGSELTVSRDFKKTVTPVFAYANGSYIYGSPRLFPSAYANNFRFGVRMRTFGGHSWYSWVGSSFFDEHPEYYALRNGKRTNVGNHLCTTNPWVRERLLKEIRELFDQGYDWVQIGQSDGWQRCECDKCEAQDNFKPWDPEVDGPDWHRWLHTTHRKNPVERIHLLHNWVAEQCAISHPDKTVHMLVYIPTRWPSVKIERYSSNIVAELCHDIPEMLEAWKDKVTAMTAYKIWWDMSWSFGHSPDITPREVGKEIRNLRDKGVIGLFNGGDCHNWGLNGPVFYTLGKLLGDPDLDENELVKEYCHGMYGAAGEAMNTFFIHFYKRPMRTNKLTPDSPHARNIRDRFPPQLIGKLEALLAEAEAIPLSGWSKDNLWMTRVQLDYLKLVSYMWVAYEAYQIAQSRPALLELKARVDAFEDFRQMILTLDAARAARFPDWGQLCKWLVGAHYWHSWYQVKDKVDPAKIRGTKVGFYAKILAPLTLDFEELLAATE